MKNKVWIGVITGIIALIAVGLVATLVFLLHGSSSEDETETTAVVLYEPEETPASSEIRYEVPSEVFSETLENVREESNTLQYNDTSICAVFDVRIRNMCMEAFGEYLLPLQDAYTQLETAGYKLFTAFETDTDTAVIEDGRVEFTVYLPGARGRFEIRRDDTTYTTKFRILGDTELLSEMIISPDGLDAEQNQVDYTPKWFESTNSVPMPGYTQVHAEDYGYQFSTYDADYMTEVVGSTIMTPVREMFNTDLAAYDMVSFILNQAPEESLREVTVTQDGSSALLCYWGDFAFHIVWDRGRPCTDIYKRDE